MNDNDSPSIHKQWKQSINELSFSSIELVSFDNPVRFLEWYADPNNQNRCYTLLVDHEFSGHTLSGAYAVEKMHSSAQRFLVTSYGESTELQALCNKLAIKLITKYFIPHLLIRILDQLGKLIIVEPNKILRDACQFRATKYGIAADFYRNPAELLSVLRLYPESTAIYYAEKFINVIPTLQQIGYHHMIVITNDVENVKRMAGIEYVSKVNVLKS